ncbi:ATP-dependent Clp protease proteolytic subunit [Phytohabitans houttuyneae]|uniref:ATP-dependent Clp protease proteolytic subunit n=1 Tax=Phytohabitans houttuyneae TaxID=1076126 RepID=A0A6V8K503_9ACTN|nr:ATP-dependent Clp protease proteolytic subunit [Phytohabitans houttuyneae]GFJ78600.1 ATP-dependent Clp protease proteolytic subunit [Phytohabitans houttuyneae]
MDLRHDPLRPWHPPLGPGSPGQPPLPPEVPAGEGVPPWLQERLFDQRMVVVTGPLNDSAATRAAAALMTLDALGSEPVRLQLATPDGDLAAAFGLIDVIDTMGAPVHAVVTSLTGGAAVGVLAASARRLAYRHSRIRLSEPRSATVSGTADEVAAAAGQYLRELEELAVRIATATGQPRSRIEDDLSAGRMLTAEQAMEYGLIDEIVGADQPPGGVGQT